VPTGAITVAVGDDLRAAFIRTYTELYGRAIGHLDIEVLVWSLTLSRPVADPDVVDDVAGQGNAVDAADRRRLYDPGSGQWTDAAVHLRKDLSPGDLIAGPAAITESQTTTIVPEGMTARIDAHGYIDLRRETGQRGEAS